MSKKSPAKVLKDKGLIPKEWDLRKSLTTGQKSWITKQSKTFAQLVRRPDDFTVKTVKPSTEKELKRAGYRVSRGRAVIPNQGGKARINVRKITTGKGKNKKTRAELRLMFDHKSERIILESGPDFLGRLSKLKPKKLRQNQAYALKIGGNQIANRTFDSLGELQIYLSNMKAPNARHGYDAMSVVILASFDAPMRPDNLDEDYYD